MLQLFSVDAMATHTTHRPT